MAIHDSLSKLACEAIDEFLVTSRMCLDFRKSDGGCLGYPSILLLLCVTNALGSYLKGESVTINKSSQKITKGEPFRVLNHDCFDLRLSHDQIKLVEDSYRNRLAHNAIIEAGSFLLPSDDDPPFVFQSKQVGIRVFSFHRCVSHAWDQFPKERIQTWEKQRQNSK